MQWIATYRIFYCTSLMLFQISRSAELLSIINYHAGVDSTDGEKDHVAWENQRATSPEAEEDLWAGWMICLWTIATNVLLGNNKNKPRINTHGHGTSLYIIEQHHNIYIQHRKITPNLSCEMYVVKESCTNSQANLDADCCQVQGLKQAANG